jgi:mono/diheme cytochrome c family protein
MVYLQECAACHGRDLEAVTEFGAPPLAGDQFLKRWQGKTVRALFELTRATMPLDSPGRLSRRQYADIIAHVLKANGFSAGDRELPDDNDMLQSIVIGEPKNP